MICKAKPCTCLSRLVLSPGKYQTGMDRKRLFLESTAYGPDHSGDFPEGNGRIIVFPLFSGGQDLQLIAFIRHELFPPDRIYGLKRIYE